MDPTSRPAVVIDNGTGYTKMGFAKNVEPTHMVPTCVAVNATSSTNGAAGSMRGVMDDLDFVIGDEAMAMAG